MDLTTFAMLAALPIMLVVGALLLWMTQKAGTHGRGVACDQRHRGGRHEPAGDDHLPGGGRCDAGPAVADPAPARAPARGDAILTGFDAFDERHGRTKLFDFSRVLTMVDARTGDLVVSPAVFCADEAGLTVRPGLSNVKSFTG